MRKKDGGKRGKVERVGRWRDEREDEEGTGEEGTNRKL